MGMLERKKYSKKDKINAKLLKFAWYVTELLQTFSSAVQFVEKHTLKKFYSFIYLFFGCIGSSLLHVGFL